RELVATSACIRCLNHGTVVVEGETVGRAVGHQNANYLPRMVARNACFDSKLIDQQRLLAEQVALDPQRRPQWVRGAGDVTEIVIFPTPPGAVSIHLFDAILIFVELTSRDVANAAHGFVDSPSWSGEEPPHAYGVGDLRVAFIHEGETRVIDPLEGC